MRLLYIHPTPVPSRAANAVQVAKMCAAFARSGVDVALAIPSAKDAAPPGEAIARAYGLRDVFTVRSHRRRKGPGGDIEFAFRAMLRHRLGGGFVAYTRGLPIGYAAFLMGVRHVLELHEPVSAFRPVAARRLSSMLRSPNFLGLVVISDRLRADYESRFPELTGRILVAHDGADVPAPVPAGQERRLAGEFRVGYVGQLYPGKGMEIVSDLAPLCPWAVFHVVGGSPEDVDLWRRQLSGHANVIFHGHVPHAETGAWLAGMDAVIAPYLRVVRGVGGTGNLADWMSPLKIFEYMAQGKAVVASDLEVLREVLRDEDNALLRAPEDIEGWVAALRRLRDDQIFRNRIGKNAQEDFLGRYTWDQRARAVLGLMGVAFSRRFWGVRHSADDG